MALDDLNSVISSILGDPQKMEQLRNVAQSLGMNPGGSPPGQGFGSNGAPPNMNNMGMNMNMNMNPNMGMGQAGGSRNGSPVPNPAPNDNNYNGQSANPSPPPNMNNGQPMGQPQNNGNQNPLGGLGGNGFNLGALSALGSILGGLNGNGGSSDKNVQLLRALQPHISPSRAGRIDDAVRIMQLMSAWPAIRDSGLLGSLGNLFSGGGHR